MEKCYLRKELEYSYVQFNGSNQDELYVFAKECDNPDFKIKESNMGVVSLSCFGGHNVINPTDYLVFDGFAIGVYEESFFNENFKTEK